MHLNMYGRRHNGRAILYTVNGGMVTQRTLRLNGKLPEATVRSNEQSGYVKEGKIKSGRDKSEGIKRGER